MIPWGDIKEAVQLVKQERADKISNTVFKVYKVSDGTVRIDLIPQKGKDATKVQ